MEERNAERPERLKEPPLPAIPVVDMSQGEEASTEFSHYRTKLSRHRTELSEHRTDLSEFRTDLSEGRTELSMRRTGMSIHRTRMSADRTLMSVLRTSLSLIGFGFTLYQAFEKLREAEVIHNATAPGNFGLAMIVLGMLLLVGGIWGHLRFVIGLRHTRELLIDEQLVHGESGFPISIALIAATVLFLIGVLAVLSIVFRISLFG